MDKLITSGGDDAMSSADIARMLEVTPARVSQLRKQFATATDEVPAFPAPVGKGARGPLFSRAEVIDWYARYGKTIRSTPTVRRMAESFGEPIVEMPTFAMGLFSVEPPAERQRAASPRPGFDQDDAAKRVWRFVAGILDADLNSDLFEGVLGYAALRELAPADGAGITEEATRIAARMGIPGGDIATAKNLVAILDSMDVDADNALVDFAGVVDDLLATGQGWVDSLIKTALSAQVRMRRDLTTPSRLAALMVKLAAQPGARTVHDPAVGAGRVAVDVARQVGDNVRLVGSDLDATSCLLAAARGHVSGVPTDIRVEDAFDGDGSLAGGTYDIVVADIPVSAPSRAASTVRRETPKASHRDAEWLTLCASRIADGGTGVVTSHADTLVVPAEAEARRNLLLAGHVVAVILLPRAYTRPRTQALWILGPASGREHVLLIDLETSLMLGQVSPASGQPLTAGSVRREVDQVVRAFRANGAESVTKHAWLHMGVAPVRQLAMGGAEIDMFAWIDGLDQASAEARSAEMARLSTDIQRAAAHFTRTAAALPMTFDSKGEAAVKWVPLSDLVKGGHLAVHRGIDFDPAESESRYGEQGRDIALLDRRSLDGGLAVRGLVSARELQDRIGDDGAAFPLRHGDVLVYQPADRLRTAVVWNEERASRAWVTDDVTVLRLSTDAPLTPAVLASVFQGTRVSQRLSPANPSALTRITAPVAGLDTMLGLDHAHAVLNNLVTAAQQELRRINRMRRALERATAAGTIPEAPDS